TPAAAEAGAATGAASATTGAGSRPHREPGTAPLAALLDAGPGGFVAVGPDGRIAYWNAAATDVLGWSAADAVGRDLVDLVVPPERRADHRATLAQLTAGGSTPPRRPLRVPVLHRDGHHTTVRVTLAGAEVDGQRWLALQLHTGSRHRGRHDDAVERLNAVLRSAEEEARQHSALLTAVMNSISDGVVVVDGNGDPLLHNAAARAALDPAGESDDPAAWLAGARALHPGSLVPLAPAELPLPRALRGEVVENLELVLRRPHHPEDLVLSVSARPLADGTDVLGAVAVFSDISEPTRTRVRLEQAETRWRRTLDNAPTGIALTGLDGTFLHTNEALRRILGYSEAELRTRTWQDITHPEDLESELVLVRHLLAGNIDDYALQKRYVHAAGHVVWVDERMALVQDEQGRSLHLVGHLQDITRQRYIEEQLRSQAAVFDSIHDAVLINAADGTLLDCNPAMAAMTGFSREELLLGGTISGSIGGAGGPLELELHRQSVVEHLRTRTSWHGDVPFRHADGSSRIAECVTVAVRDVTGRVDRTISVLRDATSAREAAEELREAEERFRHAFDRSPLGMQLTDLTPGREGRLLRVNDAYCAMLGRSAADLLTMSVQELTHPEDAGRDDDALARLSSGREQSVTYEKRYLHATGHQVWVAVSTAAVTRADGSPHYAVAQVTDITDRRAEEERLTALALRDALTGLGNRVLLTDRLRLALHRSSRSLLPLAVLFCDLNGFKPVNDTYGHAAGDELLRTIGARIRDGVRPADTVCRVGGDEFVILCEDLDSPAVAEGIAERIREAVGAPVVLADGTEVAVGVSIGVSLSDCTTTDPAELLARADAEMYRVKSASRSASRR
ncbi:PAS domain S-box protein, partial [Kineococcus glutinatus]|uniref:PAS domain S-box protein n=1 Tax=Kineococcus glutinatus TaxID=1070872 RepID=UPI0031F0C7F8